MLEGPTQVQPMLFALLRSEIAPDLMKFLWDINDLEWDAMILETVSMQAVRWIHSDETNRYLGLAFALASLNRYFRIEQL